jgi:hypothetical protein
MIAEPDAPQERDVVVDRAVAKARAALARQDAAKLNRAGEFGAAGDCIKAMADWVRSLAGDDAELQGLVAELDSEEEEYRHRLSEGSIKARFMANYGSLKGRTRFGGTDRAARPGLGTIGIVSASPQMVAAAKRAIGGFLLPPTVRIVVHDESAFGRKPQAGPLNEIHELRHAMMAKKLGGNTVSIVLLDQELPEGHIVHWQEKYTAAVVSTVPWTDGGVHPEAWIAALLLEFGPRAAEPTYVPLAAFHPVFEPCLLDFTRPAAEIGRCMRAGMLCAACRARLAGEGGLGEPLVLSIVQHIQGLCG